MNSLGKTFSERLKTGTDALKQKSEAFAEKAGEAIANAQKAVQENLDHKNDDPNNFQESAIAPPAEEVAVPGESVSEDDHDPALAAKKQFANMAEGLKGISFPKFPEKEIVVTDLVLVLSSLFDFNPKAKKQHEMVEALELEGITTWRAFLLMSAEDIPTLRKKGDVPVSKNSIRMLTYLKQFTMYNINNKVENAKDPELYTPEAFDAFVDDLQLGRKTHLSIEEPEDDGKPKRNIRQSITGFASRLKPGARAEDGSVADILMKAKAKVMIKKNKGGDGEQGPPSDEVSVDGAGSVISELGNVPDNEGAIEEMKKNVDDLASKLKKTSTETAGKTKEEVQKLMVPLLSNLKKSQDKFGAMIEARKKKMAERKAEKEGAGETIEGAVEANDEDDDKYKHLFDDDTNKLKSFLSKTEKATMKAFHDAEKAARQAARKAGILDNNNSNGATPTETVSENGAGSVTV